MYFGKIKFHDFEVDDRNMYFVLFKIDFFLITIFYWLF